MLQSQLVRDRIASTDVGSQPHESNVVFEEYADLSLAA